MAQQGPVLTEREGPVAVLTIDRPARRNAVDRATAAALDEAVAAAEADDEVRAIVLTGAGGTFCAGADLHAVHEGRVNRLAPDGAGPMGPTRRAVRVPVLAAIEGHAVAGGLELALWCDLRIVAEDAVLGVFCRRWGVPLVDGGTVRLPRVVGQGVALDLVLTGRPVHAEEALRIGLATRVVPSGTARAAAVALATELAAFPQACLRADLASTRTAFDRPLPAALTAEHVRGVASMQVDAGGGDLAAGVARFVDGEGRHGAPTAGFYHEPPHRTHPTRPRPPRARHMPTENLTRDEAATRADLLEVHDTVVHLDLTTGPTTFDVVAEVTFTASTPGASTFLDATCVAVDEVILNGVALDVDEVVGETRITLPDLAAENTVRVVATMPYKHEGKGLHRFVDPGDDRVYLHSQFEPFDAHLVYPCFDQPDLKTAFTLAVDAPAGWVVVSNELVEQRPAEGAAGTWRFATTDRISTYFSAVVAGEYREFRHDAPSPAVGGQELPMAVYCRHSLAPSVEKDLDEFIEVTHQGLAWMSEAFGHPYPFSKYDQLFVPEFSAGAMENPGCITFSESFVFRSKVTDTRHERRGEVVLHEMAHMWFGDLVTMRWWDDLWLNESFATFMALLSQAEATRWSNAWVTFGDAEKAWALRQDQLPTTHPVAADMHDILSVHQNFDGITYAKGASVLRQLVAWVGQDEFLDGCKAYFRDHAWGNATLADFLGTLEAASGRELGSWSKEWLETTGVNTLRPQVTLDDDGTYAEVAVVQEAPAAHPTLRRHRVAVGVYERTDAGLERRERVELDIAGERTVVEALTGVAAGDVLLVNDDDLTFCKLRFDPASVAVLTTDLHHLADPLARALAWASAWDAVRDGELSTGDFLALVRNNVAHEEEVGVLERLLLRARSAIDRYGDPTKRAARLAVLAEDARAQVESATPGSDRQHAWVRHWVSCGRRDDHVAEVRAFLDGDLTFPGVELDTDLRWHVVLHLASAGAAEDGLIDAELARDPTDLGERNAASARASRPDVDAKESAWSRLMEEEGLSHTVGRQLWGGLMQLHQEQVLTGLDDRYFDALAEVWDERSIDWALEWSEGCFPHPLASEALLARVEDYVGRDDVPGPLRRVLLEQQDTLARTLAARAADVDA